jgi:hypothetical protein
MLEHPDLATTTTPRCSTGCYYSEAKGLSRGLLAGRSVPPLVTQIADGESGGVMNEFPPKYHKVVRACSGSRTPMVNVTEYLESCSPPASGQAVCC